MPLYEYQCRECGKVFEKLIESKFKNDIKHCGKEATRLITGCNHKINGYCYNNDVRRDKENK